MIYSFPISLDHVSLEAEFEDDMEQVNRVSAHSSDVIYMIDTCKEVLTVDVRNIASDINVFPIHNLWLQEEIMPEIISDEYPKQRHVRLILPGSGVRGAFQAGFVEALHESGRVTVDKVYGTSVGSIIAPYAVSGKTQELRRMITDIRSLKDVLKCWPLASAGWIQKLISMLGPGAFKELTLLQRVARDFPNPSDKVFQKCECVAWDVHNRQSLWFTGKNYLRGMKASCALVGLVPPVKHKHSLTSRMEYKDTILVDSKTTELVPLDKMLADFEGTYVLVLPRPTGSNIRASQSKAPKTTSISILHHVIDDASSQLLICDVQAIQACVGHERLVIVEPPQDYFDSSLDVDNEKIMSAYDAGKKAFWDSNIVQV